MNIQMIYSTDTLKILDSEPAVNYQVVKQVDSVKQKWLILMTLMT